MVVHHKIRKRVTKENMQISLAHLKILEAKEENSVLSNSCCRECEALSCIPYCKYVQNVWCGSNHQKMVSSKSVPGETVVNGEGDDNS